uniref:Uncharacterized protein n=1 Tax=Cannabis sativa TaxID=3483 RepID=A0A803QRZ3_CANSA
SQLILESRSQDLITVDLLWPLFLFSPCPISKFGFWIETPEVFQVPDSYICFHSLVPCLVSGVKVRVQSKVRVWAGIRLQPHLPMSDESQHCPCRQLLIKSWCSDGSLSLARVWAGSQIQISDYVFCPSPGSTIPIPISGPCLGFNSSGAWSRSLGPKFKLCPALAIRSPDLVLLSRVPILIPESRVSDI